MSGENTKDYELNNEDGMIPEDTYPQDNNPIVKKSGKKKRRKKRYTLKFIVFILICIGVYAFLHSSIFNIDVIKITGNSHFTIEEIETIAGSEKGANLFEIRTGQMEDKLLGESYIQEAKVSRHLPKTVSIDVKERKALATVQVTSGYVIVDKDGFVLEVVNKMPKLTLLQGLEVEKAEETDTLKVKEVKSMEKALAVLEAMDLSNLKCSKIEMSGNMVKANIKKNLWCSGKYGNVIENINNGHLKTVVDDLDKKGKKKGMIYVGDNQFCSFRNKIK